MRPRTLVLLGSLLVYGCSGLVVLGFVESNYWLVALGAVLVVGVAVVVVAIARRKGTNWGGGDE
jgi:hypothetical protein